VITKVEFDHHRIGVSFRKEGTSATFATIALPIRDAMYQYKAEIAVSSETAGKNPISGSTLTEILQPSQQGSATTWSVSFRYHISQALEIVRQEGEVCKKNRSEASRLEQDQLDDFSHATQFWVSNVGRVRPTTACGFIKTRRLRK
jgi:hypothetical protein